MLVLSLLILAGAATGAWAWWKWRSVPHHRQVWQQRLAATTLTERTAAAVALEQRFAHLFSATYQAPGGAGSNSSSVKPGDATATSSAATPVGDELGPRSIVISVDEANDWLETRSGLGSGATEGVGWLHQQGVTMPPQIKDPSLAIEGQQVLAACTVESKDISQIVSLYCDVTVPQEGKVTVRVTGIKGGDLPLPAKALASAAAAQAAEKVRDRLKDQIESLRTGKTVDAVWPLPGNRVARLKGLVFTGKGIELSFNVVSENDSR